MTELVQFFVHCSGCNGEKYSQLIYLSSNLVVAWILSKNLRYYKHLLVKSFTLGTSYSIYKKLRVLNTVNEKSLVSLLYKNVVIL